MFIIDNKIVYDTYEHLTINKCLPNYYEEIIALYSKKIGINKVPLMIENNEEHPLSPDNFLSLKKNYHKLKYFLTMSKIPKNSPGKIFFEYTHIVREQVDEILFSYVKEFSSLAPEKEGYTFLKTKKALGIKGYNYYLYYLNITPVFVLKKYLKNPYNDFGVPLIKEKITSLNLKKIC